MDNGIFGTGLMRDFRGKRIVRLSLILIIPVFIISCAEPIQRFSKNESSIQAVSVKQSWKKIAVLPFTGDPAFRRPAAEWFDLQVAEHGLFEIIDPGRAEIELKRNGIGAEEKAFQNEEAVKAGRMLGAARRAGQGARDHRVRPYGPGTHTPSVRMPGSSSLRRNAVSRSATGSITTIPCTAPGSS